MELRISRRIQPSGEIVHEEFHEVYQLTIFEKGQATAVEGGSS